MRCVVLFCLAVLSLFICSPAYALVSANYSGLYYTAIDSTDSSSLARPVDDDMKIQVSQLDVEMDLYDGIGGYWAFSYGSSDSLTPDNDRSRSYPHQYEAIKVVMGLAPDNSHVPNLGFSRVSLASEHRFLPQDSRSKLYVSQDAKENDGEHFIAGETVLLANTITRFSLVWGHDARAVEGIQMVKVGEHRDTRISFSLDLFQSDVESYTVEKQSMGPDQGYLSEDTLYAVGGEGTYGQTFYRHGDLSFMAGLHVALAVGDPMKISGGYFLKSVWENIFDHGFVYLTVDGTILDVQEYLGEDGPNDPELIVPTYTGAFFPKFYFGGGFAF